MQPPVAGYQLNLPPARGYAPLVNLNSGAISFSSQRLNEAQRLLLMAANANSQIQHPNEYFEARNLPSLLDQIDEQEQRWKQSSNMANFLGALGQMTNGRGINKQQQTPAQADGIMVHDPTLFGVQSKDPIPYQKVVQDSNNLALIARGFQENHAGGGVSSQDTAITLANVMRKADLINEAFTQGTQKESIYSDRSRNPSVNLHRINVINSRRDDLFSIL